MSKHSKSLKRMHLVLAIALCALLTFTFLHTENSITGAVTSNGNSTGSVTPFVDSATINTTTPTQNSTHDNITTHVLSNAKNIISWQLNSSAISSLILPFEGVNQTSDKNAYDYSPNSFNGTVNGAVWNSAGGFDGNGSYDFNGSSDYITFADNDALNFGTGDFSYMMWVKMYQGIPGNIQLLAKRATSSGNYEIQATSSGLIRTYTGDSGSTSSIDSQTSVFSLIGVWTHVAVVRENGILKLYLNGVLENSTASSQNVDSTGVLSIGRDPVSASEYFNGTIDEVQIFNISLTPEQIFSMYNNQSIIHNNQTEIADQWGFCVTPNGNLQDGTTTCSNSLTVQSTPPTISSALINSTTPTVNSTNDNITSHVISIDPNGDPVKLIYNWQLNGSETVALNLPFERVDRTDSGNTYDYSINANHGIDSGSIVWNQTGGKDGGGTFDFDGVDDLINVTSISAFDLTNELTISAWVNPDRAGYGDWETIVMKGADQTLANDNFNYNLRITDQGNLQFSVNGSTSGYSFAQSSQVLQNNSWSLVTGVYNGTDLNVYINQSSVGTFALTEPITTSNQDILIGNIDNDKFKGQIDELQIYNVALDAEQVAALYNGQSGSIVSSQTNQADNWSYCVTPNDGWENGKAVCSQNISINSIPSIPALEFIANNSARTNRSAPFRWNSSTEADSEQVTYQIQVSNETDFSTLFVDQSLIPDNGTSQSNFTSNNDLPVDTTFYWRARAYDGKEYSDWSEYYEFQVLSSNVIAVPSSAVNFGEINATSDKNTTDAAYDPIILINDGNIPIDVYMNSSQMFTDANSLWQYQIEENETGAYVSANETWTNFTIDANDTLSIYSLLYENFTNAANAANIHLLAQVASSESPGAKASTIYIRTEASP